MCPAVWRRGSGEISWCTAKTLGSYKGNKGSVCGGTGAVRHRLQVRVEKEEKVGTVPVPGSAEAYTPGARSPVGTVELYIGTRDVRSLVFIHHR